MVELSKHGAMKFLLNQCEKVEVLLKNVKEECMT